MLRKALCPIPPPPHMEISRQGSRHSCSIMFTILPLHPTLYTKWQDIFAEGPWCTSLCSILIPLPTWDLGWQLLHGVISTGVYLAHFTDSPYTCPIGAEGDPGTYLPQVQQAASPLPFQNLLLSFWLHFSTHLLFYAPLIHSLTKPRTFGQPPHALAKFSIYQTRKGVLVRG